MKVYNDLIKEVSASSTSKLEARYSIRYSEFLDFVKRVTLFMVLWHYGTMALSFRNTHFYLGLIMMKGFSKLGQN